MTLSLIISIYNREETIKGTLESIFSQTGHSIDYEIIIVDDGSEDRSVSICESMAATHPQIRVFTQQHAGPGGARNFGLAHARGEYVWFVDSDDFIEEGAFAILQKELPRKSDMIVFPGANLVNGKKVRRSSYHHLKGKELSGADFLSSLIKCSFLRLKSNFSPTSQLYLFNKEFLRSRHLTLLPDIFHEDLEFTPRALMQANSILVLDDILYLISLTPNSIVRSVNAKKGYDNLTVAKSLYHFVRKHPSGDDRKLYVIMGIAICNSLDEIWKAKAHRQQDYIDDLRVNKAIYFPSLFRSYYAKFMLMAFILLFSPRHLAPVYNRFLKKVTIKH